jgi:hypothetical protein
MQLSHNKPIRGAVAALTATLLGPAAGFAADTPKVESSLLIYSETNRVKATEGVVSLQKDLGKGRTLGAKLTFDGLTGASPNGATPSRHIQTFTRPSGNGSYTVPAGEIPLDDTFKDTRLAGDVSLTKELDRLTFFTVGGHYSGEHDYTSLGINGSLSRDFDRRNRTLGLSAAITYDVSSPEGGVPSALTSLLASEEGEVEFEGEEREGEGGGGEGKTVIDLVASLNQVIDRKTIARFNYSLSHSTGYMNDPYKFLSVVQPAGAADPGEPVDYLYESRPRSRNKQAAFGEIRRYIAGSTVDVSYRYFWDDWGIRSNTVDLFYRFPLGRRYAVQPHYRWYKQTEADFYAPYLLDGSPRPAHASADYRLAPFTAYTFGLKFMFPVSDLVQMSVTGEYYHQTGDLSPPSGLGALSDHKLFPDLRAVMVRLGLSYGL